MFLSTLRSPCYWNRVQDFFEGIGERDKNLSEYQDLYLIRQYCQHIAVPFEAYRHLLGANVSNFENLTHLMTYEMFEDYKADFDKSTVIKNLKKKSFFKNKTKAEQVAALNKRFIAYLHAIEKEKLYYFMLAYESPQKVLIVKSPTKNKEQKQFLGYEWSGAKGSEGIKYYGGEVVNEIITPLFDPLNPDNPDKINYYIQQNFVGNALNPLPKHCAYASVIDILDFARKDFNRAFSLTPKKEVKIESQWELVKLGTVADIQSGGTPKSQIVEYWNGDINWATLVDTKEKYLYSTQRKITKKGLKESSAKLLPINTVIFSSRATIGEVTIAKVETATNQGYKNFICNENKIKHEYLYEVLKRYALDIEALASGMTYKEISKNEISNFKIPLPPLPIQAKIVAECTAIDKRVEEAQGVIARAKGEIEKIVTQIYNANYDFTEIKRVSKSIQYGLNEKMNIIRKGFRIFRMNEIIDGRMNDNGEMKYADISATEFKKYKLNQGDILFNRTNSIVHVGKTGLFDLEGDYCFASYLIRVVVDKNRVNPFFVNLMMNSTNFQTEAKSKASKAINQANINATIMGNIKIPVPPLTEQESVVAAISDLETQIAAAQAIINGANEQKQAVMDKYL